MRRLSTALLAAATVLLPVLPIAAHADVDLGASGGARELVVTGHAEPDPDLHVEALSGTLHLDCLGCLLDKRQQGRTTGPGSVVKPQLRSSPDPIQVIARRLLEPSADRSPRAPPIA